MTQRFGRKGRCNWTELEFQAKNERKLNDIISVHWVRLYWSHIEYILNDSRFSERNTPHNLWKKCVAVDLSLVWLQFFFLAIPLENGRAKCEQLDYSISSIQLRYIRFFHANLIIISFVGDSQNVFLIRKTTTKNSTKKRKRKKKHYFHNEGIKQAFFYQMKWNELRYYNKNQIISI